MFMQSDRFNFTAIAQSPTTLFVCWDAARLAADKLSGRPGGNVRAIVGWILRLTPRDKNQNAASVCDYAITPAVGNYYVQHLSDGTTYQISLMVQDTMGEKHTLLVLGAVTMPRRQIAAENLTNNADGEKNARCATAIFCELCGGENEFTESSCFNGIAPDGNFA